MTPSPPSLPHPVVRPEALFGSPAPTCWACVEQVFQRPGERDALPQPATALVIEGALELSGISSTIPCGLYLWPDGRSYTGQPAAEIHTLGCQPLLESIVAQLAAAGARPAQPGEFTLRAFLAGRLDLTRAEAVLGVIDAADRGQLDVALAQLAGGLASPLGEIRDSLVELLAHLEAGFDFADEDLPFIGRQQLDDQLAKAAATVDRLARQMSSRSESTSLSRVVLLGRPNAGKSSLFNALATRAGALVSNRPGTTRDYVTGELNLDGVGCLLIDTAGMDPTQSTMADGPATAAQSAAKEQVRHADVEILCLDSTRPLDDWERSQLEEDSADRVLVLTKIDTGRTDKLSGDRLESEALYDGPQRPSAPVGDRRPRRAIVPFPQLLTGCGAARSIVSTSSVTGQGIDALRTRLRQTILANAATSGDAVHGTAVRCRRSLELAAESLDRARNIVQAASDDDLVGEELVAAEVRLALDEIGQVVGTVYTDDVLDRVFSRFCVGK